MSFMMSVLSYLCVMLVISDLILVAGLIAARRKFDMAMVEMKFNEAELKLRNMKLAEQNRELKKQIRTYEKAIAYIKEQCGGNDHEEIDCKSVDDPVGVGADSSKRTGAVTVHSTADYEGLERIMRENGYDGNVRIIRLT